MNIDDHKEDYLYYEYLKHEDEEEAQAEYDAWLEAQFEEEMEAPIEEPIWQGWYD